MITFTGLFLFSLLSAGEKDLTEIQVRAGWEKYPQADFGSQVMKLDPVPVDAMTNFTAKHTREIRARRLAWLSNFAQTNLARDAGIKGCVEVGMAYAGCLFYPEAVEWMEKALAINSNSSFVYNSIANIHYLSGNIPDALSNYQQALALSRNDPKTLLNLAFIHYETGRADIARIHYLKAILIDPALDRPEYQVLAGEDKSPPATPTPALR